MLNVKQVEPTQCLGYNHCRKYFPLLPQWAAVQGAEVGATGAGRSVGEEGEEEKS